MVTFQKMQRIFVWFGLSHFLLIPCEIRHKLSWCSLNTSWKINWLCYKANWSQRRTEPVVRITMKVKCNQKSNRQWTDLLQDGVCWGHTELFGKWVRFPRKTFSPNFPELQLKEETSSCLHIHWRIANPRSWSPHGRVATGPLELCHWGSWALFSTTFETCNN